MPLYTFFQMEGIGAGILIKFPALCQSRYDLIVTVMTGQSVKNQDIDLSVLIHRRIDSRIIAASVYECGCLCRTHIQSECRCKCKKTCHCLFHKCPLLLPPFSAISDTFLFSASVPRIFAAAVSHFPNYNRNQPAASLYRFTARSIYSGVAP